MARPLAYPARFTPMTGRIARPHRGYHGPRGTSRFFEGWYYRLSLPDCGASFATIYSIEDPHGGSPFSQSAVQVLGKEGLRVAQFPEVENFWADPAQLAFGHRGIYQASDHHNQGQAADCAWEYRITPVTGWGRDEATMGLLSYLPVYEVGWQICLAHGWAEGWFQWQDQRYEFSQAPVYIEKNWGLGYPKVWFWLQCNCFTVTTGTPDLNLTLTSGGGLRRTLWWEDEAAMIGVHYRGRFFNFRPETGAVRWETASVPHGTWKVWGKADGYEVEIEADVAILHTLLGPTATATLHPISLHSLTGHLNLRLYRGARKLILEAHSDLAALEVGGGNWDGTWSGSCN